MRSLKKKNTHTQQQHMNAYIISTDCMLGGGGRWDKIMKKKTHTTTQKRLHHIKI